MTPRGHSRSSYRTRGPALGSALAQHKQGHVDGVAKHIAEALHEREAASGSGQLPSLEGVMSLDAN